MSDGALLLDKPVGISSNRALQEAKKLLGAKKAGHAGTLDPLASGLLVLLFGEATKLAGPLLDADKEYVATLKLGESTTTGDAEGEVVERKPFGGGAEDIARVLKGFLGTIEQTPPMYSALKHGGTPLYKLARRGEAVERRPRSITISRLDFVSWTPPLLEIDVRCSKGTYVRTLAEDIGVALGSRAHLSALRRIASGSLSVDDAVTLDKLEALAPGERNACLIPLASLLGHFPRAELDAGAEARFRNGQPLAHEGLDAGICAVFAAAGTVIGLGVSDGAGQLRPLRLTASQAADKHRKNL